jgi:hypothetical protein
MIPARYTRYVYAFFMAFLISCLVSFVITLSNVGLIDGFFGLWLRGWGFAFIVAFPSVVLAAPLVSRLVALVIEHDER